ncbi:unnamed protein product [Blepharisma stoltei]|uniref:Fructose-bisphosphatase n=1 Tax=Blepharisma stoltei TaxID=1481888 RepID=A0AAU9JDX8_9CILI|nr:unnamed protein product [Blepharisma stoltei]
MDKQQSLISIKDALLSAAVSISQILRDSGDVSMGVGSQNAFGEHQLRADLLSNEELFTSLRGKCRFALSEENPVPQEMGGEHFVVTFDPLDGSSIIDTNFSVGTIFGVWDVENIIGASGRDLVFAAMVIYGSRTTVLLEEKSDWTAKSIENSTVSTYTLTRGEWVKTRENLKIANKTKLFAPANLRAQCKHDGYKNLVRHWEDQGFTLRYTGGLAPDTYQIFIKGSGIFSSPVTESAPAKLRLLYECAPIARLIEIAGGEAYGVNGPVLDIVVDGYEHKSALCVGSAEEVRRFIEFMNN